MSVAAVAGAAIVAGGAVYSANKSAKAQKGASKGGGGGASDPGADINNYVTGMNTALPEIIKGETQYRPQFQGLNLGDMNSFLNGASGQQGVIAAGGQAQLASQGQLEEARGLEFANMRSNTGDLRGILQSMSPEAAAQVANSTHAAQQAYQASSGMTGQEMRQSDQLARESFAARGRINDNGAVASELLGRDDVMARKRREAMEQGQNAYSQAQNFYSQPGLQMLGGTPASIGLGQSYLGMGASAIGQGTPQMYDIGAALNQGAVDRQNQFAAASSNYAAKQQSNAALIGAVGNFATTAINSANNAGWFGTSTANAPKATPVY